MIALGGPLGPPEEGPEDRPGVTDVPRESPQSLTSRLTRYALIRVLIAPPEGAGAPDQSLPLQSEDGSPAGREQE